MNREIKPSDFYKVVKHYGMTNEELLFLEKKYNIPMYVFTFPTDYEHFKEYFRIRDIISDLDNNLNIYNYLVNLSESELQNLIYTFKLQIYNSESKKEILQAMNNQVLIKISPEYDISEFLHINKTSIIYTLNDYFISYWTTIGLTSLEKKYINLFKLYIFNKLQNAPYEDICIDCSKFSCAEDDELLSRIDTVTYEYTINAIESYKNKLLIKNDIDLSIIDTVYILFVENNLRLILNYYNTEMFDHFKLVNCYVLNKDY